MKILTAVHLDIRSAHYREVRWHLLLHTGMPRDNPLEP